MWRLLSTVHVTRIHAKLVTQNTVIYCEDLGFVSSWYASISKCISVWSGARARGDFTQSQANLSINSVFWSIQQVKTISSWRNAYTHKNAEKKCCDWRADWNVRFNFFAFALTGGAGEWLPRRQKHMCCKTKPGKVVYTLENETNWIFYYEKCL